MKLAISYFYQIRFFKPYMIPVSTAHWDPAWYHDWAGAAHVFVDKRGVINGLRTNTLNTGALQKRGLIEECPCKVKDPTKCQFVLTYEKALSEAIDEQWSNIYEELNQFSTKWCKINHIVQEPIIVFIVHEAPWNKCSERWSWIKVFKEKGIECNELKYPIKENYK